MSKPLQSEHFDAFRLLRHERRFIIEPASGGQDLDLYLESARLLMDALFDMGEEDGELARDERADHGWAVSTVANVVTLLIFQEDGEYQVVSMTWGEAVRLRVLLQQWLGDDAGEGVTEAAAPAAPQPLARDIPDERYTWTVTLRQGGGVRLDTRPHNGNEESIALATDNAEQLANALRALANKDVGAVDHPTLLWRAFRRGDYVEIVPGLGPRHYTMTATCAALIALAISELRQQLTVEQQVRISGLRPGTIKLWRDEFEERDALRWRQLRRYVTQAEVDQIMGRNIGKTPNAEHVAAAVDLAADAHLRGDAHWVLDDNVAMFHRRVKCGGVEISVCGADDGRHRELLEQIRDLLNGD